MPNWFVHVTSSSVSASKLGKPPILGTYIGPRLFAVAITSLLIPILALVLVVAAIKVWRYGWRDSMAVLSHVRVEWRGCIVTGVDLTHFPSRFSAFNSSRFDSVGPA
jgi:hypothetical protein